MEVLIYWDKIVSPSEMEWWGSQRFLPRCASVELSFLMCLSSSWNSLYCSLKPSHSSFSLCSFVTGWRGQRRGERQDRAGRSSRLLHGPHPREVARVSPSVADLPSLFFRRSVSSHSSWNSITYRHQSEWRSHHWIFNQYNSKTCLGKVAPLLLKWPWTEHPEVSVFAHQIVWLLEMCRFPRQMVLDRNSFFCVFGATTSP